FFFSSRRRHTRSKRDWSSDVCSSDLSQHATEKITHGSDVTVSCCEGDTGKIYDGLLEFSVTEETLDDMPEAPLKIMMNVANPDQIGRASCRERGKSDGTSTGANEREH